MTVKTAVWNKKPARFDMCGRFLGYPLAETDETIRQGIAARLLRYAIDRAENAGLNLNGWDVTVGTSDGDERPADRSYFVEWKNTQGTTISLNGILTRNGWPFIDHRFSIEE